MKTHFIFTDHFVSRFSERILNQPNKNLVKNIKSIICNDIKEAKENRTYLNEPRFILWLWEKYKGVNGTQIFETDKVIYITKQEKGMGFKTVVTCWSKEHDKWFGKNGMFKNSALSNQEIYNRIAELKVKYRHLN